MASSPPTSKVDELCRYILHANSEESAQCFGRRQVTGEAGTAEEVADDWLEEDETFVIEFPDPELDTGKRKKKKTPSSGRLPVLTSIRSSQLFLSREMASSALLPISARRGPSGTPHSGAKRRLSSGPSALVTTKFKIIRKDPTAYKELPKLSHEDVNTGLQSPTESFAPGQTTTTSSTSNTPASSFPCPSPSYRPSSCSPSYRVMARCPQENPDSSGHCNVRVTVLAPEPNERLSSSCKVKRNSVFVKPHFWFRLQFESNDPANTEVRVSAHYVHNGAPQTPLVSCEKCYDTHRKECDVCASRTNGERPFLCSNNARFPVYPTEQGGSACEVEASFTPLDSFVSSADPKKVTLQMTAICLTSCGHHKKRKVTLLVEARQRDDTTTFPHVETFAFVIRCCQSPTRDSNPKGSKSIQNTPFNNPSMSPALLYSSPPLRLPGLCPNTPPSACLSPDVLDDSPMLSSAASPPFSPSHEIHLGEFEVVAPLQGPLKTDPYALLPRTNSHHMPLVPGNNKPNFDLPPAGTKLNYSFEVPAADLDTLNRHRDFLHRFNIETLPGYKIHVS